MKRNINGQFSLPLFTDRAKAPKSGTYDANINIADEMFNNKITYNYSSPIAGIISQMARTFLLKLLDCRYSFRQKHIQTNGYLLT